VEEAGRPLLSRTSKQYKALKDQVGCGISA